MEITFKFIIIKFRIIVKIKKRKGARTVGWLAGQVSRENAKDKMKETNAGCV